MGFARMAEENVFNAKDRPPDLSTADGNGQAMFTIFVLT